MGIDAESFRGKLYLLVIDKIVIGAVIALALVVYDRWKTGVEQVSANAAREVQLQFERAKLVRELVPILADDKASSVTKAYSVRAALLTGSIDPVAGIHFGRLLLTQGLDGFHFKQTIASAMPRGIPAVAQIGATLVVGAKSAIAEPTIPRSALSSDRVSEMELWQELLIETLPTLDAAFQPLQDDAGIAANLRGLFNLLYVDKADAIRLSSSASKGVRLIGNIRRLQTSPRDTDAARGVADVLLAAPQSEHSISVSLEIVRLYDDFGPPTSALLMLPLAELMTRGPLPPHQAALQSRYTSLQSRAAELFAGAVEHMKEVEEHTQSTTPDWYTPPRVLARPAEEKTLAYLKQFVRLAQAASDPASLGRLVGQYNGGMMIDASIRILRAFDSAELDVELKKLRDVDGILSHFPGLPGSLEQPNP